MRNRKANSCIAIVSLVVYLAAGGGHVHGMVLCVEASGEVSLEAGENGSCVPFDLDEARDCASRHLTIAAASAGGAHCEACVDIPIPELGVHHPAIRTEVKIAGATQPPLVSSDDLLGAFDISPFKTSRGLRVQTVKDRMARLRSVVRLI